MIKKLRNQPYAPKSGSKLPNGNKEEEKQSVSATSVVGGTSLVKRQEVLGRTDNLLSFDTTRISYKIKKN
jgi:hypothetical protein